MRVRRARISKPRGGYEEREVKEYWLTEAQATTILLQLRTPQARRLRVVVVKVVMAARRGMVHAPPPPVPVPVLSTSPIIGDTQLRAEFGAWCAMAARNLGVGVHRVHGAVRRQFRVPGIYQLPVVLYPMARELVESLGLRRLLLPQSRASAAPAADPRQQVLPLDQLHRRAR